MKFCSILKTPMYAPFRHPHQNHRREAAGVLRATPVSRQVQRQDSRSWRELSEHKPEAYSCCLCTINGITLLLTSTSVCVRHSLRSTKMWWLKRIIERFEQLWMVDNEKTKPSSPTIDILVVQARHKAEKRDLCWPCDVWVALESSQQCIQLSGLAPSQGESSLNFITFLSLNSKPCKIFFVRAEGIFLCKIPRKISALLGFL